MKILAFLESSFSVAIDFRFNASIQRNKSNYNLFNIFAIFEQARPILSTMTVHPINLIREMNLFGNTAEVKFDGDISIYWKNMRRIF